MSNNNKSLGRAKVNKYDEYYTQYKDIETEIEAYLEQNPSLFHNKTLLCPCDDPERSNFTKYFKEHFQELGLKRLISTCIAKEPEAQLSLFTDTNPHQYKGKIQIVNGSNHNDSDWNYLNGNGDFRSEQITRLRDESDIIITNPPFSLFNVFLKWVMNGRRIQYFSVIGSGNALTVKDIFPLLKDDKVWLGYRDGQNFWMHTPEKELETDNHTLQMIMAFWYTNIDHKKHNSPKSIHFQTQKENLKKEKMIKKCKKEGWIDNNGNPYYPYLDNYPGVLEVPFVECIPSDYDRVMAVPITYICVHNSKEYSILNANDFRPDTNNSNILLLDGKPELDKPLKVYGSYEDMLGRPVINGKQKYRRIFIQKKGA